MAKPKPADLVLSGGGVKGIGLVGSVVALMDAGYGAQRVSGTSAGSIVGAIVAAASMGNQLTGDEVKELALQLDYHKFTDPGAIERFPILGPSVAVLRGTGIYKGDYAHDWIRSQLANLDVRTFGDLAIDDDDLPPERRYKLVVTVADVTTGQLVRLPWDYRRVYGLDADEQPVADAVRASMAIPFFFRPVTLTASSGLTSTLVDGGILSNFPIDSLDRHDGRKPRWPSFGVTVLPNLPEGNDKVIPALAPLRMLGAPHLLEGVITAALVGRDQAYLNEPWVSARTIRVDSTDVGFLDFDISDNEIEALYAKGYAATEKFLATWDWDAYLERFRR
ncbi:putative esterase of the alpha-beta hydrolase superfamily [Mycobacterium sp. JS623]|uniref:patatin-like phospholipase family protein n=1 Tax=Mycobacterium sp. JS623 TaxID=212767 RepID=UPI0002A54F1D|nr:patatin-like phospholipase family protein [Mycobacterium sp. JS623]AGB24674.1 putative esterase of the alpha-beta hydrolase superfamily [Mycobacterium sp. JS623]